MNKEFETCECPCGQRIEYPVHARGTEINCPDCQRKLICIPRKLEMARSKKFQSPASRLCMIAALIGILSPILILYGNHRSQLASDQADLISSTAQNFSDKAAAADDLVNKIQHDLIRLHDDNTIDGEVKQIYFEGSWRLFETNIANQMIVAYSAKSEDARRNAKDYSNQSDALIKSAKFFSGMHLTGIIFGWLCPALFLLVWIIHGKPKSTS
jgi:hypothetical protein